MKTKLLLLLVLANFSIYAQTNLVPNGNFETWSSSSQPDSWYRFFSGFISQSTTAQNGSSSTNMMVASGTFNYINSEYFPVTANKTYRITMYHKLVKGTFSAIDFSIYHKPGTFKEEITKKTETVFSTSEWKKIEFEYTPTVSENIEVDIWTTGSLDSEILVDNVSVVDVDEVIVPVKYTLIPDREFEKKLIQLGIDSGEPDGQVLTSKIAVVKSLDVDPTIISDLTGIQDFAALETLQCRNNCSMSGGGGCGKIKELDVSKNILLTGLYCEGNQIKNLDITKNTKLLTLYCSSNLLTSLDISQNKDLRSIYISNNLLTQFDISKNPSLNYVICYSNKLTNLDLSDNKLEYLDCNRNQLTDLDVSKQSLLRTLNIEENKITKLDLSNSPDLNNLYCKENLITELNVTSLTKLKELRCSNNNLSNLDVTKNPLLTILNCGSNKFETFDISQNLALKELECSSLKLKELDVTKHQDLRKLNAINNNLKTIDISNNLKLIDAYLSKNELTEIDITKNVLLEYLLIPNNKLTVINTSNNEALKYVDFYNNFLTTFDVSGNKNVIYVNCNNNKLTSLNLRNGYVSFMINLDVANYKNNPDLKCIQVTDANYAKTNWTYFADPNVRFSEDCAGPLTLAANNFSVETKGESCLGENNGELNITAKEVYAYQAAISGKTYSFTNNTLKVPNLAPGTYTATITIPGENFEQTFNLTIAKGLATAGSSNTTGKKVAVEITEGTVPYTVFVDGIEQFQTTDSNFSLDLNQNGLLEVSTAKACEGLYSKKIAITDILGTLAAYPNPTLGNFEIEIPTDKTEVLIELYNFSGQLVSTGNYLIDNGKAQLNLSNQPSGIYAAKIYLSTPEFLKIIKK